jgi:hypothetical protein
MRIRKGGTIRKKAKFYLQLEAQTCSNPFLDLFTFSQRATSYWPLVDFNAHCGAVKREIHNFYLLLAATRQFYCDLDLP